MLHADRLARLANRDVDDEPLLRRITVDKSAKRLRSVLAGALWDTKMIQVGSATVQGGHILSATYVQQQALDDI